MFVIQSMPRCGTHLLRTALCGHSGCLCYAEVFHHQWRSDHPREAPPVGKDAPAVLAWCENHPQEAGFCVHAYTGLRSFERGRGVSRSFRALPCVRAGLGLWDLLPRAAKVITLFRENLLQRYVSAKLADCTGRWNSAASAPPAARIQISPSAAVHDMRRTASLYAIARRRFPEALVLSYESIVASDRWRLDEVQAHLGLPVENLQPRTVKLAGPLPEAVENYAELAAALARTEFARFLDDG